MRLLVLVCALCASIASCTCAEAAPVGDAGDVGIRGDGALADPPDAWPHGPLPDASPYEGELPPCSDPAFWSLPPNHAGLVGALGACSTSYAQPLLPFDIQALHYVGSPAYERICYRVTESTDSGWAIGAIVETGPRTHWTGYVAGRTPHLAFEMRAVFEGGWLSAVPRVTFDSASGVPREPSTDPILFVEPRGWATATEVFADGRSLGPATAVRALFSLDGYLAWIDETSSGLELVVEGANVRTPVRRRSLGVAASVVAAMGERTSAVLVLDAEVLRVVQLDEDLPLVVTPVTTLEGVPDALVAIEGFGTTARFGDRLVGIAQPLEHLAFASGVVGVAAGEPSRLVRDTGAGLEMAPIVVVWTDTVSVDVDETTWEPVDPRVGAPLLVLADGRVVGTAGTIGPPRDDRSPEALSTMDAFGGPITTFTAFGVADAIDGWARLAVRTAEGDVVYELGTVGRDACGI